MACARRAAAPVPRGDVCFRPDKQTAGFKLAVISQEMQRSPKTEKEKELTSAMGFCIVKKIFVLKTGAITFCPSPPDLHCTEAADGRFQSGHLQQKNAVESFVWKNLSHQQAQMDFES
jgi:hypothetical protein